MTVVTVPDVEAVVVITSPQHPEPAAKMAFPVAPTLVQSTLLAYLVASAPLPPAILPASESILVESSQSPRAHAHCLSILAVI